MKKLTFLILCSLAVVFTSCNEYPDLEDGLYAEFVTNQGTFLAELYFEETPITVASFVSLAEGTNKAVDTMYQGERFYDGLVFHRVIPDFMIQGGDPEGTGSGGPGYKFPNEIVDTLRHDSAGILSMANSGPDTNGSQFFITLKETPWLDGIHTVFGKVVEGQEVVDAIGQVETNAQDRPVEDVVMEEVNIIRKGEKAEDFNASEMFEEELRVAEEEAEERARKLQEQMNARVEEFEELKAEAEELESGLKIVYNEKSNGEKPSQGQTVLVDYAGFLDTGLLFDTSMEDVALASGVLDETRNYQPIPMPYSPDANMIPGFKEGIQLLSVGDKATLFIPSHLGYGPRGMGGVIPPNADLIFQVELVGIQE